MTAVSQPLVGTTSAGQPLRRTTTIKNLFKLGKLNSEKLKKPSKSRNSHNFDATETGLSFLNPDAKTVFNHLWLAFTKAPILLYFDPECHI